MSVAITPAIAGHTLEEIGFSDRAVTSCSRGKENEVGLRREPIRFQFDNDYARCSSRLTTALQRLVAGILVSEGGDHLTLQVALRSIFRFPRLSRQKGM